MSIPHCPELTITSLSDFSNITPECLFSLYQEQPWAMWLDSGNSDHIDSRFDVIVWQPTITLTTTDQLTTVRQLTANKEIVLETSNDDPLALAQKYNQELFSSCQLPVTQLPFVGGLLGYFSYDLGRRFEHLPVIAKQDISLPEMALGIYQQALIFDNKQQTWYLVSPKSTAKGIIGDLSQQLYVAPPLKQQDFSLTSQWLANMDKHQYQDKFNLVQQHLLNGDCYQINLTQRFSAQYQGNEFNAYCALRKENNAPFSAFLRFQDHSILSISPERFLQLHANKVQTKPIKGTLARTADKTLDQANALKLKSSQKDNAENLMIVDLLRNDLSKVCTPGSVKVPKLFDIESFPSVHHLVSTVEGDLASQYQAVDLLRAAFPGGSITGAPKIRAMEIIEQLEPQRRSIYCGSIGYISACGKMDTSITIRTLVCEHQQENNTIHCWAGGGIVYDSNADAEYQESFDKVNKILPILAKL